MSQQFKEDFSELGLIYEAYFAKKAGGQDDLTQGSPSFRKGYMQPGGVNAYAFNDIPQTTTPVSDEEVSPLMDKIDALIKEAESYGQSYAVHQLISLKKFIEKKQANHLSMPY
jgi:hypothetical protein